LLRTDVTGTNDLPTWKFIDRMPIPRGLKRQVTCWLDALPGVETDLVMGDTATPTFGAGAAREAYDGVGRYSTRHPEGFVEL
jgi:hypothetical protein